MTRSWISILILVAIVAQAMIGGFGGATALCLGGGHEHAPEEVVSTCGLACSHDSVLPTPVPIEDRGHGEDCPCTDVEIDLTDLLIRLRGDADSMPVVTTLPAADLIVGGEWASSSCRATPRALLEDPGGGQRLAIVRSTRLII